MSTVPEPLDVLEAAKPFLTQCGSCDAGLPMSCSCAGDPRPVMSRMYAEIEALRAKVSRVGAVLSDPYQEPPPNGTLIVRGRHGGHQDLPYAERAFVRDDREVGAYPDGDWCPVEGDDLRLWQWGEMWWLDDPECDRGTVSMEPYVHVEDIAKALAGDAV